MSMILKSVAALGVAGVVTAVSGASGQAAVGATGSGAAGVVAPGYVYVLANDKVASVVTFKRGAGGGLTKVATTRLGVGSKSYLHVSGALQVSADRQWLAAVVAGGNKVALTRIGADGRLGKVSLASSGGTHPVSLAFSGHRLYVLNQGDKKHAGGVAGLRFSASGKLSVLPGARKALSGPKVDSAQVGVSPDGSTVIVTERINRRLSSYPIAAGGALGKRTTIKADASWPFGFGFSPVAPNVALITDAGAGAKGASFMSSYGAAKGRLTQVGRPLATKQTAACWIVTTKKGFAYVVNAGGTISVFKVSAKGRLSGQRVVKDLDSASDIALSSDQTHVYLTNVHARQVRSYRITGNGGLTFEKATKLGSPYLSGIGAS